jgi:hypothetical protein
MRSQIVVVNNAEEMARPAVKIASTFLIEATDCSQAKVRFKFEIAMICALSSEETDLISTKAKKRLIITTKIISATSL